MINSFAVEKDPILALYSALLHKSYVLRYQYNLPLQQPGVGRRVPIQFTWYSTVIQGVCMQVY